MDENRRRSGQIPAFGNWDYANELPITQYFECARQAGLIRHISSSGDQADPCVRGDLYAVHFKKPSRTTTVPPAHRKTRGKERRYYPHVKEQKRVGKVCDVTEPVRKARRQPLHNNDAVPPPRFVSADHVRPPKPVDEDLYKIPPELHTSKQKKMLGFLSRCLVPDCAA